VDSFSQSHFKKYGITGQQFNVLRILRGQHPKPATIKLLKERMLDKMSDTSRIVDRLLKKELVKKTICKGDRRLVDIIISERGKKILEKLDACNEQMDSVLKRLSVADAKKLNQLLDKIRS